MTSLEAQMAVDINKIPTKFLERAYWRRKLPPAFRFYLEMLARNLMLNQPNNVYAHSAGFFEELLIQRDTELSLLPYENYFDKLKVRGDLPPGESNIPPAPQHAAIKCVRCGRGMKTTPVAAPEPVREPSPVPETRTKETSVDPCRCARCGRELKMGPGTVCGSSPVPTLMEGDDECRVIALPHRKDAFGRLITRRGEKDEEENLLNCRALAYIVDY